MTGVVLAIRGVAGNTVRRCSNEVRSGITVGAGGKGTGQGGMASVTSVSAARVI